MYANSYPIRSDPWSTGYRLSRSQMKPKPKIRCCIHAARFGLFGISVFTVQPDSIVTISYRRHDPFASSRPTTIIPSCSINSSPLRYLSYTTSGTHVARYQEVHRPVFIKGGCRLMEISYKMDSLAIRPSLLSIDSFHIHIPFSVPHAYLITACPLFTEFISA